MTRKNSPCRIRRLAFRAATEVLDELGDLTGETALLAVYDPQRQARMYVATSPSRRSVQFVPQLFKWLPLHAAATAMAILAYRPEQERVELYEQGLPLFAGRRPTPSRIEKTMTSIRSDGYALSRDQADVGASAVAAPIRTAAFVQSSIAVAVPNQRFDQAPDGDLARHVMRAAEILSRRMGDSLSVIEGGGK